ncbi:unnamed protein product [Paramecium octaurelia]|uniref:Uncharacterized protein n=1 Tax=Paramecium octaurelia TaxID=43137 RepID=A0A8S1TXK0_PAROT|nr:unnamed protein product [Paramecium octaurelia]
MESQFSRIVLQKLLPILLLVYPTIEITMYSAHCFTQVNQLINSNQSFHLHISISFSQSRKNQGGQLDYYSREIREDNLIMSPQWQKFLPDQKEHKRNALIQQEAGICKQGPDFLAFFCTRMPVPYPKVLRDLRKQLGQYYQIGWRNIQYQIMLIIAAQIQYHIKNEMPSAYFLIVYYHQTLSILIKFSQILR